MSSTLNEVIQQAETLTMEEQLHLIAHLTEKARQTALNAVSRRPWRDLRGAASYPLVGEDAQAWVSHSRQEENAL